MKQLCTDNYFKPQPSVFNQNIFLILSSSLPLGIIMIIFVTLFAFAFMYQKYKELQEKYQALEERNQLLIQQIQNKQLYRQQTLPLEQNKLSPSTQVTRMHNHTRSDVNSPFLRAREQEIHYVEEFEDEVHESDQQKGNFSETSSEREQEQIYQQYEHQVNTAPQEEDSDRSRSLRNFSPNSDFNSKRARLNSYQRVTPHVGEPQFGELPFMRRQGSRANQYSTPFHQPQKVVNLHNFDTYHNFNLNRNSDLQNNQHLNLQPVEQKQPLEVQSSRIQPQAIKNDLIRIEDQEMKDLKAACNLVESRQKGSFSCKRNLFCGQNISNTEVINDGVNPNVFSEENIQNNFLKDVPKLQNLNHKYMKEHEEEDPYGFKSANQSIKHRSHMLSDRAHLVRNSKMSVHQLDTQSHNPPTQDHFDTSNTKPNLSKVLIRPAPQRPLGQCMDQRLPESVRSPVLNHTISNEAPNHGNHPHNSQFYKFPPPRRMVTPPVQQSTFHQFYPPPQMSPQISFVTHPNFPPIMPQLDQQHLYFNNINLYEQMNQAQNYDNHSIHSYNEGIQNCQVRFQQDFQQHFQAQNFTQEHMNAYVARKDSNSSSEQDQSKSSSNYVTNPILPQYGAQKYKSPPLNPMFQQSFDLLCNKQQQSASPNVQRFQQVHNNYYYLPPNLTSQSYQDIYMPQCNMNYQQDMMLNGDQEYIQKFESYENQELDHDQFPCHLYLETGRYKNSFQELQFLGRGGFGVAHKVQHKLDNNYYAIKRVRLHLGIDQDIKDHKVYREIMALPQLNHKNVVRYFGCWAERIERLEERKIQMRVEKIRSKIEDAKQLLKKNIGKSKSNDQAKEKEQNKKIKFVSKTLQLQEESEEEEEESNQQIVNLKNDSIEKQLDAQFEEEFNSQQSEEDKGEEYESQNEGWDSPVYSDEDEEDENTPSSQDNHYQNRDAQSHSFCIEDFEDSSSEQDEENSHMEKFDDEALIQFIKKEQRFISIDLMIQMEYCSGQTFQQYLQEEERHIDREKNYTFFKQLLTAVKHIHQSNFIHRDIKPANIFIKEQFLKIGDFGLARQVKSNSQGGHPQFSKFQQALNNATQKQRLSQKEQKKLQSINNLVRSISQSLLTTQVGTSTYLSPEQEQNKPYDEKVDIFALGLILCEMCCKFKTNHERIQTLNDLKYKRILPPEVIKQCQIESEIIILMTQNDPEQRPSAQDLLKSPLLEKWGKFYSQSTVISPTETGTNSTNVTIELSKLTSQPDSQFSEEIAIKGNLRERGEKQSQKSQSIDQTKESEMKMGNYMTSLKPFQSL